MVRDEYKGFQICVDYDCELAMTYYQVITPDDQEMTSGYLEQKVNQIHFVESLKASVESFLSGRCVQNPYSKTIEELKEFCETKNTKS